MSEQSFSPAWRAQPLGRRGFLRVSAASASTVALVATTGCSTSSSPSVVPADPYALPLPTADSGLLYYAYLLAVAQASVYQTVLDMPPADLTAAERAIFSDLRDHEVIHRELLKYVIDPTATKVLFPTDFAFKTTSFTLTTRSGVLAAAAQLADLAAAAYPVLVPLVANSQLRSVLLKISSVYARHSATVRDLISPGSFANDDVVVNTDLLAGQAITKTPTEVIAALAPYFAPYIISVVNLPVPV